MYSTDLRAGVTVLARRGTGTSDSAITGHTGIAAGTAVGTGKVGVVAVSTPAAVTGRAGVATVARVPAVALGTGGAVGCGTTGATGTTVTADPAVAAVAASAAVGSGTSPGSARVACTAVAAIGPGTAMAAEATVTAKCTTGTPGATGTAVAAVTAIAAVERAGAAHRAGRPGAAVATGATTTDVTAVAALAATTTEATAAHRVAAVAAGTTVAAELVDRPTAKSAGPGGGMGNAITADTTGSAHTGHTGVAPSAAGTAIATHGGPDTTITAETTITSGTAVTADPADTTGTGMANRPEEAADATGATVTTETTGSPGPAVTARTAIAADAPDRQHSACRISAGTAVGAHAADPAGPTQTPSATGTTEPDQQTGLAAETTIPADATGEPGSAITASHHTVGTIGAGPTTATGTAAPAIAEQVAAVTTSTAGTAETSHQIGAGATTATGTANAHQPARSTAIATSGVTQPAGATIADHPRRAAVTTGHTGVGTGVKTRPAITEQPPRRPAIGGINRAHNTVGDRRAQTQRHKRRVDQLIDLLAELTGNPELNAVVQRRVDVVLEPLRDRDVDLGRPQSEIARTHRGPDIDGGHLGRGECRQHIEDRLQPIIGRLSARRRRRDQRTHPQRQERGHRGAGTQHAPPPTPLPQWATTNQSARSCCRQFTIGLCKN